MKGLVSIYLDIFRFLAALGVFLWHAEQPSISNGILPPIYFNHLLVIVFFVISGYVIAASADRPDRSLANYGADRLARLSSVVIPALLLTYGLDAVGSKISPEIYASVNPHWQGIRFLANLLYCQQIWFFCVNPSSNNPFWSLGYEFWYYVLFGVWIFVKPRRMTVLLLIVTSLFIGPKILLLFPAWAVGALAFHAGKTCRCRFPNSLFLFVATWLATVVSLIFGRNLGLDNGKAGEAPLYYSSNCIGDNIFAIVVAANFLCCALLSANLTKNLEPYRVVRFIRWMASHTFSLYLYHLPVLWFIRSATKYDPHHPLAVLAAMSMTLLIVAGLARLTEERYPALRTFMRQRMAALTSGSRVEGSRMDIPPATAKNATS